jgi:F0F1-type ATP synthase assembly protein I
MNLSGSGVLQGGFSGVSGGTKAAKPVSPSNTRVYSQKAGGQSQNIERIIPNDGIGRPRLARPLSLMTAAVAGGGATYGIMHGINTGVLVSFFTGAAVKSVTALSSFVGAAAALTLLSGYCYHRCSARLNRLEQGIEARNSKKDSALGTNKFLAALSFLGSSTGLGLSIGALVTTMTGGTDFGLGLIIGGSVGFAAGLVSLVLMGAHNQSAAIREAKQPSGI